MKPTLGSLFDGSGGFPLAGYLTGITPLWASEVEPYPIAVTRSRFPAMEHLGSVTDIHGGEIEPVDIITFGSPCQDLSVAGKRAGLKHEANGDEETTRSGLFVEAVRIIREMREATNGRYPNFALWENVPGAFSSNKGEDFRTVLAELIGIVEPNAAMPSVPKGGWAYADSYTGNGWSLAYRVFDAQHWGVPQRRRRIHLVLDLRGQRAREVLFECEGVRGYFVQSGAQREGAAEYAQGSPAADDREGESAPYTLKIRSGCEDGRKGALIRTNPSVTLATNNDQYLSQPVPGILLDDQGGSEITVRTDEKSPTLRAETHGNLPCVVEVANKEQHLFENHSQDARYKGPLAVCPMLPAQLGTGGNNQPFVVEGESVYCLQGNVIDREAKQNGCGVCESVTHTINSTDRHAVAYCMGNEQLNQMSMAEQCNTLDCMHDNQAVVIASETNPPVRYIVRRLTPTECARLQGFPDKWGHPDHKDSLTAEEYRFWLDVRNTHAAINGKTVKEYTDAQMLAWYNKLHTDSAEYKMWGNGIALPPALYVMQGIAKTLRKQWLDDLLGVGDS